MIDLLKVSKPSRYVGGEFNTPEIKKDAKVRVCFCFPDTYEVGMSNLGMRILYYLLNSLPDVSCERCFTPWEDYAIELKNKGEVLRSLETGTSLKDFDMLAFSVQYEMCFTNVLYMLDLAGIEVYSKDRQSTEPIILAGGPCSVNLEPIADFVDLIDIGDGEDVLKEIAECLVANKGRDKIDILKELDLVKGCIVPSFYPVEFKDGKQITLPNKVVEQRKVRDMNTCFCPQTALVPNLEIVHDRAVAELFRGCANGCRFCQAGFIYRPVRERSIENVLDLCKNLIDSTGYEEISLNSLSTSDYSQLSELLEKLTPYAESAGVNFSLPSMRVDSFIGKIAENKRKSSLTFAVEAGTQRLREVINKNITEENIMDTLTQAFRMGYSSVKLYFMLGLPTETMEDVYEITQLAYRIHSLYSKERNSKKPLNLNVSASVMIPKPFTPFQWEKFDSFDSIRAKQMYLKDSLKKKGINFSYHDYDTSLVETILARGDRRLSAVIKRVYDDGGHMDGWSEFFNIDRYLNALKEENIDINDYVGEKSVEDILPWDYVDIGVKKEYLIEEKNNAYKSQSTNNCYKGCNNCGLIEKGWCQGKC